MSGRKSAAAVNLSVFLLMIGVGLIVALLPRRIMNLSASVADVGILASAYAIPNMLLQIPVGRLADHFGFKGFIVCGYLLCGLSGLLYYIANTPQLFYWGRFLQGIAEVPIWALAPALLSLQYASQKGTAMGRYNAALHGGLTVGGGLSIVSAGVWTGSEPFLVFAVLSLLGGGIIARFVENPAPRPRASVVVGKATTSAVTARIRPTNIAVLVGIILYGAEYGIFITIVPSFLISARGDAPSMVGSFFTLFYVSLSIAQLFAGRWSDRKGRKPVMLMGLAMTGAGIALFHRCASPAAVLALGVASLGMGMFCVSAMAFLNEQVAPSQKGLISGAFFFCWGIGYFAGPLLLGWAGGAVGYPVGFTGLAVLNLMQWAAIYLCVDNRGREWTGGCPERTAIE